MANSKNTPCTEQCGATVNNNINTEMSDQLAQFRVNNYNSHSFAFDDVIRTNVNLDMYKLFEHTSYKYTIEATINGVITQLFSEIKMNRKLMKNMSPEIIYLLNTSTCCISQLCEYIFMLYICKFLSFNGADRCKNIMEFRYSNILTINHQNYKDSLEDTLRYSEIVDAYLGFSHDILTKRYWQYMVESLNVLEEDIIARSYKNPEQQIFSLQSIITNIITSNIQFIIELNNYFYNGSPIFYVNDRMVAYYYGDIQIDYIGQYLNYITPNATEAKLQNLLDRSLFHYYDNIKNRISRTTNNEVKLLDI